MELHKSLLDSLDQIAQVIRSKYIQPYKSDGIHTIDLDNSLMSGHLGISLFCMYYAQLFGNDEFHTYALDVIDDCLLSVDTYQSASFCNGIGGLAWTINHFQKNNWIELNSNTHDIFDNYLYGIGLHYLETGVYDYLHGGMGIGLYYLERNSPSNYLFRSVELIEKNSICTNSGVYWLKPNTKDQKDGLNEINLSLSHGISSIMLYLAKIYNLGHCREATMQLIEGSIDFIFQHPYHDSTKCKFPNKVFHNIGNGEFTKGLNSRIAWCYGDLGLAVSLMQIGEIMNSPKITGMANEIGIHTLNRRSDSDTGLVDAGICHGYFGVALVYQELYELSGNSSYSKASDYWFEKGLEDLKEHDINHYKYKRGDEMVESDDLLLGISGIGLAIMNRLYKKELSSFNANWKTLLLMS